MTAEEFADLVDYFARSMCPEPHGGRLADATRERILGPGRARDEDAHVGWTARSAHELLAEAAAEPADCAAWVVAAFEQAVQEGIVLPILVVADVVRLSAALLAAVQRLADRLPHQTRPSQEACS